MESIKYRRIFASRKTTKTFHKQNFTIMATLIAAQINVGDKLVLTIKGTERTYKVTEIANDGQYKLFNKFVVSFFVDIDFINKHISE